MKFIQKVTQSKLVKWAGRFIRTWLIPNFLLGKEKAVAAFVTPLLAAWIASLLDVHVEASLIQQVVGSLLLALTVHGVANTSTDQPDAG